MVLAHLHRCRRASSTPLQASSGSGLAGVVGLSCALCVAVDTNAPRWVGQAVQSIAPFGRLGMADIVRKEVQNTIQMFLKLQQVSQQSWKDFQDKLSPAQLDLLNEYKGELTYFS